MTFVLAQLEFAQPSRLIVLALLPALLWLAVRGRREKPIWQRLTSGGLHCLVVTLLCVAWASPGVRTPNERRFVVFVADQSASCAKDAKAAGEHFIEQALAGRKQHRGRRLDFAGQPGSLASLTAAEAGEWEASASDLASAIALAEAACPPDHVPQIMLLSDGLETRRRVLATAAAAEIPISIVPLAAFADPEFAVEQIALPLRNAAGEAFEVSVTIAANHEDSVAVKLYRDSELIAQQQLDVTAGRVEWQTRATLASGQREAVFRAVIEGGNDRYTENNSRSGVVLADEPAQVLIVDSEPAAATHLRQSLAGVGLAVEVVSPPQLPQAASALARYRLIVLSDVSATTLGPARLAALDRFVRSGGGLMAVGGEDAFGAAAYELTALEKMLPVVATEQPVEKQKSLALVLVVDKSLSMKQERRLSLAKEAAKKVVDVLQPVDQAGVLAFGNDSQWVSPLGVLDDKDEVLARIDRLEASGLTNLYPALQRAYLALSQADADSRHAILLTDGVPSPGDFDEIAAQMAAAGITVSTVSLGPGADQTILQDIARIARGKHHHADDPNDLPQILERETRSAASRVTASQYQPIVHRRLPGLDMSTAPPLLGYVATRYKPGAELLLLAGEGDPLLAWWRYGRGVAMVLTTDVKDRWGKRWQSWPGYDDFWRRLAKHAMRPPAPSRAVISVVQRDERLSVSVDAVAGSEETPNNETTAWLNGAVGTLKLRPIQKKAGAAEDRSVPLIQTAPGRYTATLEVPQCEAFVLTAVVGRNGETLARQQRGFATAYAEEFRLRPADEEKLRAIAATSGGQYDPEPTSVFAPDGRSVDVVQPLWPYVLIAALLVYLVDLGVRRIRAEDVQETVQQTRKAA